MILGGHPPKPATMVHGGHPPKPTPRLTAVTRLSLRPWFTAATRQSTLEFADGVASGGCVGRGTQIDGRHWTACAAHWA